MGAPFRTLGRTLQPGLPDVWARSSEANECPAGGRGRREDSPPPVAVVLFAPDCSRARGDNQRLRRGPSVEQLPFERSLRKAAGIVTALLAVAMWSANELARHAASILSL